MLNYYFSGVYCDSQDSNLDCAANFEECISHADCCSGRCEMTAYVSNRICLANDYSFGELAKGNNLYILLVTITYLNSLNFA